MELMQRHLDEDLNDSEHEAMLAHLQQCPDCAEMFSRLQQLSQELASLPKVTPPFSLVDSILPQLAEIDRAGERGGEEPVQTSTVPKNTAVIPLAAERPRRFKSAWSFAAAGGIVAAGLLLALFINDMDGTKVADESQLMPKAGSQSSTSYSSASMPNRSAADQATAEAAKEAPGSAALTSKEKPDSGAAQTGGRTGGGAAPAEVPVKQEIAPEAERVIDQRGGNIGDVTKNGNGGSPGSGAQTSPVTDSAKGAGEQPPVNGGAAAIPGSSVTPPSAPADETKGPNDTAKSGLGSSGSPGSDQNQQKFGISAMTDPAADTKESAAGSSAGTKITDPAADAAKDKLSRPDMAGLLAVQESFESEDGVLVATIDPANRRVVVTTNDDRHTQMFVSASWGTQDSAKLLTWKGSAQLTYSVTAKDGTAKTYVVDIAKNAESLQKP
nr:zf-HC2 domain-containing protein [Paenibacillus ginsengarvi]